jgi:hypothetical protein
MRKVSEEHQVICEISVAEYAVNSILYQRGVYAPETFERKDEYGIALFVTKDKEILTYFDNILPNLEGNIYIIAATVGWDVAGSV